MKKILITSYNKVPIGGVNIVEGTGLRAWRLACGIAASNEINVVIAVADKGQDVGTKDGIEVIRFEPSDEGIESLLSGGYDTIISSYWMSGITERIFDAAPRDTQLIADAYSPFYIEYFSNSSSKAADDKIMQWYPDQLHECNKVLATSDYILVSNDSQKKLYTGVISALGAGQAIGDRFITVPGAVEYQPRKKVLKKIDLSRIEVLWFGGMYPWFDFSSLIEIFASPSISKKAYLRVVGGSNPMYKKTNQRYNGQYYQSHKLADSKGLIGKSIFFEDWVSYGDRLTVFDSADCAVSINNIGPESEYSWRIRVADLAGNDVPVLTNGGDPLGEMLIANKMALKVDFNDLQKATKRIEDILDNTDEIKQVRHNLTKAHDTTHIYSHTRGVIEKIKEHTLPRLTRPEPLLIKEIKQHKLSNKGLENTIAQMKSEMEEIKEHSSNLEYDYDQMPKTMRQLIKRRLKKDL